MSFFNTITSSGIGKKEDLLKLPQTSIGDAKIRVNADVVSGNLFVEDVTKTFTDIGFSIDIGMVYNSQGSPSWRINQGKSLGAIVGSLNSSGSTTTLINADGHVSTFSYDDKLKCYTHTNSISGTTTLTQQPDKSWICFHPDSGVKEFYSVDKKLQRVEDRAGRFLEYGYDNKNLLNSITGTSGQKLTIDSNINDTKIYFEDKEQKTLWLDYQFENGQLKKTSVPLNKNENYEVNYSYTEDNLLKTINQSDQTKVGFEFNKYNDNFKLKSILDGLDQKYSFDFKDPNKTIITDPLNNNTQAVTENGILKQYISPAQSNNYLYYPNGKCKEISYLDGTKQTFEYDQDGYGLVRKITDRNNNITVFNNDKKNGLLLSKTTYTNSNAACTDFYSHNNKGQLCYQVDPCGKVTAFEYDVQGNRVSQRIYRESSFDINKLTVDQPTDPELLKQWCAQQSLVQLALTEWQYNYRGQIKKEISYANIGTDGKGILDAFASQKDFDWDIQNNLCSATTKLNNDHSAVATAEYDALKRIITEVDKVGRETIHIYKDNIHTAKTIAKEFKEFSVTEIAVKDSNGRVISIDTQADGKIRKKTITYDIAGRPCIIENPGQPKQYIGYNEAGLKLFSIDSAKNVTKYIYDENNNVKHTFNYKTSIDTVDEVGLKQGRWQPNYEGDVIVNTRLYDAKNQLIYTIDGDNYVTENLYDSHGNLVEEIVYDKQLLVPQRELVNGKLTIQTDSKDRHHSYFYNAANLCIAEQLPSNKVLLYSRNLNDEIQDQTLYVTPQQQRLVTFDPSKLKACTKDEKQIFLRDALGQCISHKDAENYETTFKFDAGGRKVEQKRGDLLKNFTWDALNRSESETSSTGLKITKAYAPTGGISQESSIDTTKIPNECRSKRFRYNNFGQVTHELSPSNALKLLDQNADVDSIWEKSIRHIYNDDGLRLYTQNEVGSKTYFYYNDANQLVLSVNPVGALTEYSYEPCVKEPTTTRYYVNKLDDISSLTGGLITVSFLENIHAKLSLKDEVTQIAYNNRGLLTTTIDGEGYRVSSQYDAFHNIVQTTKLIDKDKKLCVVDTVEYDAEDRMVNTIKDVGGISAKDSWSYDDAQGLTIHTDGNNNSDKVFVDRLHRVIKTVDAINNEIETKRDILSRPESIIESGITTTLAYENNGLKTITTSPMGKALSIEKNVYGEIVSKINADKEEWKTEYTLDGHIKTRIDPDKNITQNIYDDAGRHTHVIDPLKHDIEYKLNAAGEVENQIEDSLGIKRTTVFERDARGRETLRTDPNGIKTSKGYDRRGINKQTIVDIDGINLTTDSEYNGLRNKTKESKVDINTKKPFVTAYENNNLGSEISVTVDPEADGLKLKTQEIRDKAGNIIAVIDPNGHKKQIFYDACNREKYIVDAMGGVLRKIYDSRGLCTEERQLNIGIDPQNLDQLTIEYLDKISISAGDTITLRAYDNDKNEYARIDPNGKLTVFKYNARRKKIYECQYEQPFDKKEFPKGLENGFPKVGEGDREQAWFYNGNGKERFYINPKGVIREQIWDAKGWLLEKRIYDKNTTDYFNIPKTCALTDKDRATIYLRDNLGRIIYEIDSECYVTEYDYDNGDKPRTVCFYPDKIEIPEDYNLVSISQLLPQDKNNIPHIQFTYDGANRKISATDQLGCVEQFNLDANGNLLEYIDKAKSSWQYKFDQANRKIEESTPAVAITRVTKDGTLIPPALVDGEELKLRITKTIEYQGDTEIITEAAGTDDERQLKVHRNACGNIDSTIQDNVLVERDITLTPTPPTSTDNLEFVNVNVNSPAKTVTVDPDQGRTDTAMTLTTRTIYNIKQKPIVIIDEAGNYSFKVYDDAGQLKFEVNQNGALSEYTYDLFTNKKEIKRYALPIKIRPENFPNYEKTGLTCEDISISKEISDEDRTISSTFNKLDQTTRVQQDHIFISIPQADADAQPEEGFAAPTKIIEYNNFNEEVSVKEQIGLLEEQCATSLKFRNRLGHVIAEVGPDNHLTTMECDRNGNETDIVKYETPLSLSVTKETPVADLKTNVIEDPVNDRHFIQEFDVRGDLEKETQKNVVLSTIPGKELTSDIVKGYKRDANGNIYEEMMPSGQVKTSFYNARNQPIIKTDVPRRIETTKGVYSYQTPVTTLGYNSHGESTRVTKHANPFENDAYKSANVDDQTTLTGQDNRGLPNVSVDPNKTRRFQTYNKIKKPVRSWLWVTGWDAAKNSIKRLHQNIAEYDAIGVEQKRIESIEGGSTVITETKNNTFGERVAEGSGDDTFPAYWRYNKAGLVYNTNANNKIATISLRDARGKDTGLLRSKNIDLSNVNESQISDVGKNDFRKILRTGIIHTKSGFILEQRLPHFSAVKQNTPASYPIGIPVTSGSTYPQFGVNSLSWPAPEIKGLEAELKVWPKDHPEQSTILSVKELNDRCGADVSKLPSDQYNYQIDYFYRNPSDNQRESYPRYRSVGSATVVTGIPNASNVTTLDVKGDTQTISTSEVNQPLKADCFIGNPDELWKGAKAFILKAPIANYITITESFPIDKVGNAKVEYLDESFIPPVWREIPEVTKQNNTTMSSCNLLFNTQGLSAGTYKWRLQIFDPVGEIVDLSQFGDIKDNWLNSIFVLKKDAMLSSTEQFIPEFETLKPVIKQQPNRYGTVVATTTPSGNTTNFKINGANQVLEKVKPEIVTTNEDGSSAPVRPTERFGYDVGNNVTNYQDPNGHIAGHDRDYDGSVLKSTRPDGVFKEFIRDILGRVKKERNPLSYEIQYTYDANNNVTQRIDGCNWPTAFAYNELNSRLSTTNGNNEIDRFDYLHPCGKPTHHYLPMGNLTVTDYNREGMMLSQMLPDKRMNIWTMQDSYFSLVATHIDLAKETYIYSDYNFLSQLGRIKSDGNHHKPISCVGSSLLLPSPGQNQQLIYDEAAHQVGILDNAMQATSLYGFNEDGQQARESFISTGSIKQSVVAEWNAAGMLSQVQDAIMQMRYAYDPKGNKRNTKAFTFWNGVWNAAANNWYTYNPADSVLVDQGVLVGSTIQTTVNQGVRLSYDSAGRRDTESSENSVSTFFKKIQYLANDLIQNFTNNEKLKDPSKYSPMTIHELNLTTSLTYDGRVGRVKTNTFVNILKTDSFNANGLLTNQTSNPIQHQDGALSVTSSIDINENGTPYRQDTQARSADNKDGYNQNTVTSFTSDDADKVSSISTHIQRLKGAASDGLVDTGYDPNGFVSAVNGDIPEKFRYFIVDPRGNIFGIEQGDGKKERLFFFNGQLVGKYGDISSVDVQPIEKVFGKLPDNINFDLVYKPISDSYPGNIDKVTAVEGDTFSSIALRVYGDPSYGPLIAATNGSGGSDAALPGMTYTIPNIPTNNHNWDGVYRPYNPSEVIQSLNPVVAIPNRPSPKPKTSHATFWHVLVEAAVGALVVAFAPELALSLGGVLGEFLGTELGWALAGAASSLASQETAIVLGDRDCISWSDVGKGALVAAETAGISQAMGINMSNLQATTDVGIAAKQSAQLAVAMQALKFATGQQRTLDWRTVVATVANTVVGAKINYVDEPVDFGTAGINFIARSAVQAELNKILLHQNFDNETLAASTLGTFLGNQLAAKAKSYYQEYQAQQAKERIVEMKDERVSGANDGSDENRRQEFVTKILNRRDSQGGLTPSQDLSGLSKGAYAFAGSTAQVMATLSGRPVGGKGVAVSNIANVNEHLRSDVADRESIIQQHSLMGGFHSSMNAITSDQLHFDRTMHAQVYGRYAQEDLDYVNSHYPRTVATLQIVGGVMEVTGSIGMALTSPITGPFVVPVMGVAGIVAGSGLDNIGTGFAKLITGKNTSTGFVSTMSEFGVNPRTAEFMQAGIDVVGPLGLSAFNLLSRGAGLFRAGVVGEESVTPFKQLLSPREFLLSKVENPKLTRIVDMLYRPMAKYGSGSTADAVRHELSTGELLSKTGHIQKAVETRNSLSDLINSGRLNAEDTRIASSIRQDLQEALSEQPWNKVYIGRQKLR